MTSLRVLSQRNFPNVCKHVLFSCFICSRGKWAILGMNQVVRAVVVNALSHYTTGTAKSGAIGQSTARHAA